MFIPREPVLENQFCMYGAQTGTGSAGVGGVVAYAGSVVYLDATATNQESIVFKMAHGVTAAPFGFLMQKVKTGYHQVHPTGYYMPGDLGSSDAMAQPDYDSNGNIQGTKEVPAGVAHLGIWDTVHYTTAKTANAVTGLTETIVTSLVPGLALWPAADEAKVTGSTTASTGDATVGTGDVGTGDRIGAGTYQVGVVMKGVSDAKAIANINNTTLYPMRVKLLV